MRKFRIVKDSFLGYEVQSKRCWFPFWLQIGIASFGTNTHSSLEEAKSFIKECKYKNPTLYKE